MGITILPYIDSAILEQNIQRANASRSDSQVPNFEDALSYAERTLTAMSIDSAINSRNNNFTDSAFVYQPSMTDITRIMDSSEVGGVTLSQLASKLGCPTELYAYFEEAAETYQVDISLLLAMAKAESNFSASSTSSCGAMGVMQLMPSTAAGLGVSNAYDPYENIMGGAKLISQLLQRYNQDVSLALAGYNAGTGNVKKYGGIPPFKETQNYIHKVLNYMNL